MTLTGFWCSLASISGGLKANVPNCAERDNYLTGDFQGALQLYMWW